MSSPTEASVGRTDATSPTKNVRTLEVTAFIGGVATTVEMQVVAIADEQGNQIPLNNVQSYLELLITEAKLHNAILLELLNRSQEQQFTRQEILEVIAEDDDPGVIV